MTDEKKQPMIPVKKADGTVVKMTMAEFKLYKEQGATGKQKIVNSKQTTSDSEKIENQEKKNLPMVEGETHLATSAPVKEVFVDEAVSKKQETLQSGGQARNKKQVASVSDQKNNLSMENIKMPVTMPAPIRQYVKKEEKPMAKEWKEEDSQSLLEGANVGSERELPVMSPELSLSDLESKVLSKLNFSVALDLRGRVLSLVTSRMKNIRTDDQFMDYAGREAEIGGLGLDEAQTKELLKVAKKELSIPDSARVGSRRQMRQDMAEKKQAPMVEPATQKVSEQPPKPEVRRQAPMLSQAEPKIRMIEKPILHDMVLPPTNHDNALYSDDREHDPTTSPVDEIRDFSITDFRRLAASPNKARELLLNKFAMLKKESYLYFIKAKQVWKTSPMYQDYLNVLTQALESNMKIEELLDGEGGGLTAEEFGSVIFVNSKLVG